MLTANTTDPTMLIESSNTPEVYIDSCEISSGSVSIYFHIEDYSKEWFNNDFVLNNLHLSMSLRSTEQEFTRTESLRSIKNRLSIHNGKAYDYFTFNTDTRNLTVSACCYNDQYRGNETTEHITRNDRLIKNTLNSEEYEYINKNIDFRILDIETKNIFNNYSTGVLGDLPTEISQLFVSHNVNKSANLGFIFDIESYLLQHSNLYKILKNYNFYRDLILKNSFILKDSLKLYKKNISKENEDYCEILSDKKILKMDDSFINNKFIVTCNDNIEDKYNKDRYIVKTRFTIKDFSEELVRNYIIYNLENCKNYIIKYIDLIQKYSLNNLIDDTNIYIFEQEYENEIEQIKEVVNNLSYAFSFYTGIELELYYSLFLSAFHPLFSKIKTLNLILQKIDIITNKFKTLIDDLDLFKLSITSNKVIDNVNLENALEDKNNINSKSYYTIEHYFNTTGQFGELDQQTIDYDYDIGYGIEVINIDNYEIRKQDSNIGLKILTRPQYNARKLIEVIKYYGVANQTIADTLQHFTFMHLDLDKEHFQLDDQNNIEINTYNDIFITLNDYNEYQYYFKKPENYYYQILGKNVYIKSIGNKINDSKNPIEKSVLFDPNIDSKINSIKYISDTGINMLYLILDKNKLIDIPTNSVQYQASLENGEYGTSLSPITDDLKDNIEIKSKFICLYNSIYYNQLIESGSNYSVFSLEPASINEIFNKKLITYNKYYVVENKKYTPIEQNVSTGYDFEKDAKFDTLPKFLNRSIVNNKATINLEEI